jgi:hypothetical protein
MSADRLNLKPDGLAGFLVSAVLGAAFVMAVFGTDFVMGRSVFWRTDMRDVTQYVAGFNFYFNTPWQSPLLAFDALNYPQGTLATFVDAIPLFALLLKVLAPDAWAPFNPYGFWVAICFVFQAIGGWCIAKELQTKSWTFLLSLLGLLLSFPALLDRIGHISLMSHWLLLFAVALYLRSQQANVWPQMRWTILCVAAFYINIYLFVMVGGVLLSACISATHQSDVKCNGLFDNVAATCRQTYARVWFWLLRHELGVTLDGRQPDAHASLARAQPHCRIYLCGWPRPI